MSIYFHLCIRNKAKVHSPVMSPWSSPTHPSPFLRRSTALSFHPSFLSFDPKKRPNCSMSLFSSLRTKKHNSQLLQQTYIHEGKAMLTHLHIHWGSTPSFAFTPCVRTIAMNTHMLIVCLSWTTSSSCSIHFSSHAMVAIISQLCHDLIPPWKNILAIVFSAVSPPHLLRLDMHVD